MIPDPQAALPPVGEADVLPTEERMVFSVRSTNPKTPKRRYRVDLLANEGRGWCGCTDFGTRRQSSLDDRKPAFTRATACKHVIKACLHVCRETFPEMAMADDRPNRR